MDFNMETAAELDRIVPVSTRKYLLVGKKIIRSGSRLCINGTDEVKNIKFTPEEIKDIDSDAKLEVFINRKLNKESSIDKTQVDMLTNTGYTQVMEPIKEVAEPVEIVPNPSSDNIEITTIKEDIAAPIEDKAPTMMPTAKTLELSKKQDRQAGLADIVVLSIIVIVYIAIIVNLIIRLK